MASIASTLIRKMEVRNFYCKFFLFAIHNALAHGEHRPTWEPAHYSAKCRFHNSRSCPGTSGPASRHGPPPSRTTRAPLRNPDERPAPGNTACRCDSARAEKTLNVFGGGGFAGIVCDHTVVETFRPRGLHGEKQGGEERNSAFHARIASDSGIGASPVCRPDDILSPPPRGCFPGFRAPCATGRPG